MPRIGWAGVGDGPAYYFAHSYAADTPAATDSHKSGLTLLQGGRRERRPKRPKSTDSFMERMEERWRRRRESGGF